MKIKILAYPGASGANTIELVSPTWVGDDLPSIRKWAFAKARGLLPPVELVELRSQDSDAVGELWRPVGDGWTQDDA